MFLVKFLRIYNSKTFHLSTRGKFKFPWRPRIQVQKQHSEKKKHIPDILQTFNVIY